MFSYLFILVLLALVWFMLIRPQRRRQQEAQRLLESIGVGKEIVTAGGLYGNGHGDRRTMRCGSRSRTESRSGSPRGLWQGSSARTRMTQRSQQPEEDAPATLPNP